MEAKLGLKEDHHNQELWEQQGELEEVEVDPMVQDLLLLAQLGRQDQPEEGLGDDLSQQGVLLACHALQLRTIFGELKSQKLKSFSCLELNLPTTFEA